MGQQQAETTQPWKAPSDPRLGLHSYLRPRRQSGKEALPSGTHRSFRALSSQITPSASLRSLSSLGPFSSLGKGYPPSAFPAIPVLFGAMGKPLLDLGKPFVLLRRGTRDRSDGVHCPDLGRFPTANRRRNREKCLCFSPECLCFSAKRLCFSPKCLPFGREWELLSPTNGERGFSDHPWTDGGGRGDLPGRHGGSTTRTGGLGTGRFGEVC